MSWVVALLAAGLADKFYEVSQMKHGERQEKLIALNAAMTKARDQMRPGFVSGQFAKRLLDPHGLAFSRSGILRDERHDVVSCFLLDIQQDR